MLKDFYKAKRPEDDVLSKEVKQAREKTCGISDTDQRGQAARHGHL